MFPDQFWHRVKQWDISNGNIDNWNSKIGSESNENWVHIASTPNPAVHYASGYKVLGERGFGYLMVPPHE